MSRKKEFSLVDDSNEELNRRKMKTIRQCLKILEEDFTEANQRNSDLCPMSKAMSVKALYDDVKDEDTDLFGFFSTETKTDFKLGLYSGNLERLARHFSHDTKEKNVQHSVSSNGALRDKPTLAPSADMVNEDTSDIDEALCIAMCNLSHLHDADEMLKYLELKVKQEGDKVAETADRTFDELITSLQSRKRMLCAELLKSINNYSAGIAEAKEVIEEKKECLTGAIRIAKELKITPSIRTYCDLPQVIYNLKSSVEAELSRVNSLKEKISPRFFLNTDEITSLLKNLGKIEWGTTGHEDNGQHSLILDDKVEMPGCDTQSSVENMFPALSRESKMKALASKLSIHKEVKNTQVQETMPMIHHQSIPALPRSPPSPDVVIEEIFEDDLEKFPAEYHADEQRKKLFKKETRFQHKAGWTELVFVSHVINPCHFYIRRYSQKKEAGVLEKKLKNFCCNRSLYLLPSDTLELGARTFIKSKETGMWCRGTITELIPLKSKNERKSCGPIRCKVCDIALLEVFLIDFGSSVVLIFSGYVPTERPEPAALQTIETDDICLFVRKPDQHIEAELAAVPPLAVRCSLNDVVPKNASEGWGEEARTKFLGMVHNKVVLMTIFREEDGVLIVDLKKPPFNKIINNMPVSVKDALVFLDLARFRSQLPSQLENNTVLQYSPPKIPQEREEVSVVICHINSPSDFYLRLVNSLDSLALPKKIQEVYKHEYGNNLEIVCPVEGQACIAKQEDGNWYRAQIIGLPTHQEVMVKYVDFGNVANLTLKDIRRVKKEFLSFPEKAIRCRLACIEPYKGASEWNREAKEKFEEVTENKLMLCSVVEILDNNILSVELYDSSAVHGRRVSINCQLVKEDLASYIRGYTESTTVRPSEIWDVPLEEIPETSEALIPVDMEPVNEGDFRSLSKKELQVRISHVVSPSKIFIQWLSSESTLKSLQEKMTTIYKESQPQSVKWESSMHCAVYVWELKQWQRGQISRIVSETSAEVILYDSGAEKTVDISCLRKLEENMKIIRTLAIECSLADIRPTGGSMQWTATVCECLSYYLTGAQVKIIIQESDVACALPVKILCKDETGQLIDISEHLIKKGLAFRNRRTDKADVACSVSKEHVKVHTEQENTQLDGCNSETACAKTSAALEENITVSEREQKSCKTYKALLHSGMDEIYKSPVIPEAKIFQAVVSCVGHDGTIYIIPKSFEIELNKLMTEIQSNFKCLGLLEPYCWKKGEACVVRGSDTMWYRGKVVELGGSTLQVQYIDHGCTERIPQCHLYPTTLYTGIPPFCIPCQLYKTVPIGNFWQQDAVDCLQELLTNEEVEIHVQELPDNPWGKLSINLYFGGMSLSSFMAYQKYCVAEDCQDIPKLDGGQLIEIGNELLEGDVPVLPSYTLPLLPTPGAIFPVRVTHLVSPTEVYICLDPSKNLTKQCTTEGDVNCDSELESLDEALKWCNKSVESFPLLTHFRTEMPCLVEYQDGLWYRAKLLSVEEFDPVKILVQFVDYGSFLVVPTSRLRHIPYNLLKYPVKAVRALLAGFKPASYDKNMKRIPYSPEWSVEALWAMMECVEGKQLSASILALSPEVTISLYEDDQNLVHMKLIEMGLADLDE
ncbi:PREDICTED: RING finger protein 17 [Phaethon lepturus]|uniref:RING finger protein 17 n=1 Tax=Phaethon lepturus TaxID=97097 RepID=UPI000530861B|nr:PREDICTED: RING finger protein 17 [Phaethon lepturus]